MTLIEKLNGIIWIVQVSNKRRLSGGGWLIRRCQCYGGVCRHNTDNLHINKYSGTIPVILVKYWLWLPDDGACVNRNMLEQLLYF
jgi:hypothetical protein